jgi:HAD superfamily hydrolase (TIGR01509 family)
MRLRDNFRPAAAIFDMDGLMLDTERPMIPLWIEAGKSMGWEIKADMVIRTIGISADDTRKICIDELGEDFPYDTFRVHLRELYVNYFEKNIAHKQGLLPLLDHLASQKMPLAVGTSARRETAVWKLQKAGILGYFKALACGDEVERGKPAPDIFLKAAELLGVLPGQCVGLEDSVAGLLALSDAGIASIFVKDIVEPPEDILSTVWKRCNTLEEAIPLF